MKLSSRLFSIISALAVVLATFASSQPALAGPAASPHKLAAGDFVPGQVVVTFTGDPSMNATAQASALAGTVSAQVTKVGGNMALLSFAPDADVNALSAQLQSQAGVAIAEPNYIYQIPEQSLATKSTPGQKTFLVRQTPRPAYTRAGRTGIALSMPSGGKKLVAEPIQNMQAMRSIGAGGKITSTYPNDPYFANFIQPWDFVGASLVWSNTTASAGICELDTGVDYLHPDLSGKITKGYDFVNADIDPMDDNGHGTHVAGIMVAKPNNKLGIAGVSTGMVVAVKVLDAQGNGTNFDISQGIAYCANRTDVKIINMSLGGPTASASIQNQINYAVNTTSHLPRKLIVAAAGNGVPNGSDTPEYPAFYANQSGTGSSGCGGTCPTYPTFANKVLAVAASGDASDDYTMLAPYSFYGAWISVVAPGTDIYSTLPYDKPFYMNTFEGLNTRYDYLSGTSMAAPFVAATAARRWGYTPTATNDVVGAAVKASGGAPFALDTVDGNFPATMSGLYFANVAAMLNRGGVKAFADDASSGNPLNGATIQIYNGASLLGSGVVTPVSYVDPSNLVDPTRVWTNYTDEVDIINIPIDLIGNTTAKVNKVGYTMAPQPAFLTKTDVQPGLWSQLGTAYVPPKSANFDFVTSWILNDRTDLTVSGPTAGQPIDLDTNLWLPMMSNNADHGQIYTFVVGPEGKDPSNQLENDPTGTLANFPFARLKREGGFTDPLQVEDITILNRMAAHGSPLVPANVAQPYFASFANNTYVYQVTDYNQTIDDDGDGCGDNYGTNYSASYDATCGGTAGVTKTAGIPLMGVYYTPASFIWKDGLIKKLDSSGGVAGGGPGLAAIWMDQGFVENPNDPCNVHDWQPFNFYSNPATGLPHITIADDCGSLHPYSLVPSNPPVNIKH